MANYKVIAQSGLKIRSGPNKTDSEIGVLTFGEIVISPADYIPILLEDDSIGWISRQYVQETAEDTSEIEAVEIASVKSEGLPIFQKDLIAKYGYPKERAGYLTTIDLREFAQHLGHVKDFQGNPWSCRIYGHELLAGPLKKAFGLLCDRGLAGELRTYDGAFNIRRMTSGSSYSVHSWGLAVDFNAAENPYGGPISFSDEFVMCFSETGWEWGGLWSTPDAMHFQAVMTRDWSNSDNPLRPRL